MLYWIESEGLFPVESNGYFYTSVQFCTLCAHKCDYTKLGTEYKKNTLKLLWKLGEALDSTHKKIHNNFFKNVLFDS